MSNATTLALLDNFRARLPGATDPIIKLEFYNTVDEVAREALRTTAPTDVDADPDTWLGSTLWVPNYQVILHGTLYRMYVQLGKPWSNPDLAKQHFELYTTYLDLARTEAADDPTTALTRLMSAVRVLVPFARDAGIELELYGVVNQVRLDALGLDELDGTDAVTTNWLTAAQYGEAYQALFHGLMGRMYSQVGKPWANPDLAQQHTANFYLALDQLRTEQSDAPATAYARIVQAIKVQLPFVRDEAVKLEVFNTVSKIRLEGYMTTPLAGTETAPTAWLTVAQYGEAYNAILHGALARLYSQPSKPWADAAAYEIHNRQYTAELDLIRGTAHADQDNALERLMNDLRVKLVGARDEVIKQELFAAADEFFKISGVWREEIPFAVEADTLIYDIESEETYAKIHRLMRVTTEDNLTVPVRASMKVPHEVTLRFSPATTDTYVATVQLTIGEPVNSGGYPNIPTWAYDQYRESFLDGTLGRMMSQVAKPYSNDRMSTYHLRRFRNAMAHARVDGQHEFLQGAQAWNYPQGWR